MKAQELRIGNLVNLNVSNDPYIVLSIDKDGCLIEPINKKEEHDGEFFTNIEPIPLTEEWLVNMGFRKQDNEDEAPYYFTNQPLNSTYNRFNGLYLSGNGFRLLGKGLEIKYVHQLQNLYFALTDEELTINEKSPTI